jgi:hypothetical protein
VAVAVAVERNLFCLNAKVIVIQTEKVLNVRVIVEQMLNVARI